MQALVDQPDQVSVAEIVGENTNVLELSVAKSDMGKVIGKQGRNAQAIRTIIFQDLTDKLNFLKRLFGISIAKLSRRING